MATDVRLQYYGAQYGQIISVLLVVSAIAAFAAAGFVYTNPPIEQTSPEETNVQSFSFDTDHRATITGQSQLFDRGRTLQNYPVYFRNSSPDVTFATTISVPQDRSVDVSYRVIANYEATFRGEVFWDQQEVVATNKWTVQDGQVQHNTTLTISEYLSRIDPFESAVGSTGTLSRDLQFVVTYSSPVDGGNRYEGQLRSTTTIQSSSDAYWVSSEIGDSTTKSQTQSSEQYVGQPNMQQVRLLAGSGGILLIAGASVFVIVASDQTRLERESLVAYSVKSEVLVFVSTPESESTVVSSSGEGTSSSSSSLSSPSSVDSSESILLRDSNLANRDCASVLVCVSSSASSFSVMRRE